MPTVLGHPIPAPRGVPTLQHQLFGLLAHLGVAGAPPFLPQQGGHAPPRPFPVRWSPGRTPVICRGLPQPPCLGTTTEGSLSQLGGNSASLPPPPRPAGRSGQVAPWKSRARIRVSAASSSGDPTHPDPLGAQPPPPPLGPGLKLVTSGAGAPRPRPAPPQDGQFP